LTFDCINQLWPDIRSHCMKQCTIGLSDSAFVKFSPLFKLCAS